MTPLVKELVSLSPEVALGFTWFDMGQVPREGAASAEAALRYDPLPFGECAVCGRDVEDRKFLLLVVAQRMSTGAQLLVVNGWVMWNTGFRAIDGFSLLRDDGELNIGPSESDGEAPPPEHYQPILAVLGNWLSRANPTGYRAAAKPNSLTNKRRAAKGKPPLIYDWHTVVIAPPQPKAPAQGGTHASPRRHERRSHWRTLKSGRRVEVSACWVGDARLGTIFKDYQS